MTTTRSSIRGWDWNEVVCEVARKKVSGGTVVQLKLYSLRDEIDELWYLLLILNCVLLLGLRCSNINDLLSLMNQQCFSRFSNCSNSSFLKPRLSCSVVNYIVDKLLSKESSKVP